MYEAGVLTCPAEKSWQVLQLLHLWNDALIFILVFSLARSSSLFLLCFSSSVLLFLLFDRWWWSLFLFCCCCCSPPLFTVRVCAAPLPAHDWHFSDTPPLALIGCVAPERWIPANQITATGWSHRQLTCVWFYCQIIMRILVNITKDCYRL